MSGLMGLAPAPAVPQICVQLPSAVTARVVPISCPGPAGEHCAIAGTASTLQWEGCRAMASGTGSTWLTRQRWPSVHAVWQDSGGQGSAPGTTCSDHLPLRISLPSPGTAAGAAVVLARASEDRFAVGSRGSWSQSTRVPEEDGDTRPRSHIPERNHGPGGRARGSGLDEVSRC